MSSIGPLPELVAQLRSELAALRGVAPVRAASTHGAGQAAKGAPSKAAGASSPAEPATPASARSTEDLASTIARRVAAIEHTDPDRRRKAFRVFLESVLLDEWGPQLINDPGFYQLVAHVHGQMEASAELRAMMELAADRLLGPGGR
ncbi:MAG TPA: hypothetical protein VGQ91_10125 [Ideonella sp.]|jgi:hypothetical protein|nr:hypothetical protein [Ideonella sp.]